MSEIFTEFGAAYKPPPLSPAQKDVAFERVSSSGSRIIGGYVDGADGASFTIVGSSSEDEPLGLRVFVREGMDKAKAARMLRVMADELEQVAALEDEIPY